MPYLQTRTDKGGKVDAYPEMIVLAHYDDGQLFFYLTVGIRTYRWMSLKELKEWLTEKGIDFRHISEGKIVCRPHVLGAYDDGSLIYNSVFYFPLPEICKELFKNHSEDKKYLRNQRKRKKKNAAANVNTKYCLHCTTTIVSFIKNKNAGVKTKAAEKKKQALKK